MVVTSTNANEMLSLSRWSLCVVGVWPDLKSSRQFATISYIIFMTSIVSICNFLIIPQTMKLFLIGNDLDMIVNILCTANIPQIVTLIKMSIFRYDSTEVKSLLHTMYKDWNSEYTSEQVKMIRYSAKVGKRIAAACIGIGYITSNIFFILRLILLQEEKSYSSGHVFLFESHFLIDVSNSPWFEVIWLLQGFCTFSMTNAYSGIDGFFAILVLHLCGQLDVLLDEINMLSIDNAKMDVKENIRSIIKRQNEINAFVKMIQGIFGQIFLIQVSACVVQFCLQGYQMIHIVTNAKVEKPILQLMFMTMYLLYLSLDFYIYCHVAEKLRTKSLEVSQAVYNCKWYDFKTKEAYDIIFIMSRAQHPLEITVGKFCSLSLNLFAIVQQQQQQQQKRVAQCRVNCTSYL
ncbi:odorant receptor 10a-like [Copidosoma floridanum]|uniref:odorant receptor 10a-like n=1 Tax=Copidosoma floridanum TaxID=29053 RepID=UPI0006C96DEE|nr:odorant receptor 10a-like [Copidosoma floridanum]